MKERKMVRSYSVTYPKNKTISSEEADAILEDIRKNEKVKSVELFNDAHVLQVEADEDDFESVMTDIVNLFRRFDEKDKCVISYDFQLNSLE